MFNSFILIALILLLSVAALFGFNYFQDMFQVLHGEQTLEMLSRIATPLLLSNDLLGLQAELDSLLKINGLVSVTLFSVDNELLVQASKGNLVEATYFRLPIYDVDKALLGYAQIAWQPIAPPLLLLLFMLVLLLIGWGLLFWLHYWQQAWVRSSINQIAVQIQKLTGGVATEGSNSLPEQLITIESGLQELGGYFPKIDSSQKATKPSLVDSERILVLIDLSHLSQWSNSLQPKLVEAALERFERALAAQLPLYQGKLLGATTELLVAVFEADNGYRNVHNAFMFAAGVSYELAKQISKIPLPLMSAVLSVPREASGEGVLFFNHYSQVIEAVSRQFQEVHEAMKQSPQFNCCLLSSRFSDEYSLKDIARFEGIASAGFIRATPSSSILSLWRNQLQKIIESTP